MAQNRLVDGLVIFLKLPYLETFTNITYNTPETFLLVADDGEVTAPGNCINFYLVLRKAGVSAELHTYKEGGHGFGPGCTRGIIASWTYLYKDWLEYIIS